jgi:hypothetical protein
MFSVGDPKSESNNPEKTEIHLPAIQHTLAAFSHAGMIVRATSRVQAHDEQGIQVHLEEIRSALTKNVRPSESRFGLLKALNDIGNRLQTGSVLVHWPAPAMSRSHSNLETSIFGAFFLSCFIILFVGSVSPHRLGIPPANEQEFGFGKFLRLSSLLFLGHFMLLLAHLLCRLAIYMQLDIVSVEVPQGSPVGGIWRLLDSAIFPASVAIRPFSWWDTSLNFILVLVLASQPRGRRPSSLCLWQYRSLQTTQITCKNAALLLFLSAAGFICFYVGARASGPFLVGMYVALFITINLCKTVFLPWCNRARCAKVSESEYSLPEYPIGHGMSPFSVIRVLYSL